MFYYDLCAVLLSRMQIRDVVVAGTAPSSPELELWLARQKLRVRGHTADTQQAIADVAAGAADAVIVVDGHWIGLLSPLHAAPADGKRPSAPSGLLTLGAGAVGATSATVALAATAGLAA